MFPVSGLLITGCWLLMTGFWLLMIYDCIQNDPERNLWFFILILLYFPGALLYFIVRRVPDINLPISSLTKYINRWTRRRELWTAEAAARNIGKAHQFVILGNLLWDLEILDRAAEAYEKALGKEPKNPQAIWGTACIALQTQNYESAKQHLQILLQIDPNYKYGDASLAYGQSLLALQELETLEAHLEKHLKHWGHPEAYIMMANLKAQQGKILEAREYLETMLLRVKGSTYYHYKRNRHFVKQGEKLLSKLRR